MESTMRRVITDILIIVFTCTMMQCEEPGVLYTRKAQILLVNKTGENIYPFINCYYKEENDIFPQYWWDITIIHPNDTACLNPYILELEEYGGLCKMYILGQTTFDKYSQKEIIENCVYDKVYTFDYEDFEKNEFTISITYTGE